MIGQGFTNSVSSNEWVDGVEETWVRSQMVVDRSRGVDNEIVTVLWQAHSELGSLIPNAGEQLLVAGEHFDDGTVRARLLAIVDRQTGTLLGGIRGIRIDSSVLRALIPNGGKSAMEVRP